MMIPYRLILAVAMLKHGKASEADVVTFLQARDSRPPLTIQHLVLCGLNDLSMNDDIWEVEGCFSKWGGCDGSAGEPSIGDFIGCTCQDYRGVIIDHWAPTPLEFTSEVLAARDLIVKIRANNQSVPQVEGTPA